MTASDRSAVIDSPDRPGRSGSFPFGGRRAWLILAAVALISGAASNWSWLVAVGLAPLLCGGMTGDDMSAMMKMMEDCNRMMQDMSRQPPQHPSQPSPPQAFPLAIFAVTSDGRPWRADKAWRHEWPQSRPS